MPRISKYADRRTRGRRGRARGAASNGPVAPPDAAAAAGLHSTGSAAPAELEMQPSTGPPLPVGRAAPEVPASWPLPPSQSQLPTQSTAASTVAAAASLSPFFTAMLPPQQPSQRQSERPLVPSMSAVSPGRNRAQPTSALNPLFGTSSRSLGTEGSPNGSGRARFGADYI